MPILGRYPVNDPSSADDPLAESRTLEFRRLDGSNPFPSTGAEVFFMPACEGLDMAPRKVETRVMPGEDGERLKRISTGKREIEAPLFLSSQSTHRQYLDRREELRKLFDYRGVDYVGQDGTFDLVARSINSVRSLRCTYVDGMQAVKRPGEGAYWAKLPLSFWAVQPYWVGEPWTTPVIRAEVGAAWFGTFPGRISSSRALGRDMTIFIPGNAPSRIVVDLVGPATSVTVNGPNLLLTIPGGLAAGEAAHIDTDPRHRQALFNGATDWSRIGPTSYTPAVDAGMRVFSIVVAGAGITTQAVVSGPSRWETPW